MSESNDILQRLRDAYPEVDFTLEGDGCHFQIKAVGDVFSGLKKLARQKMLNKVLSPLITEGIIHAVNYQIFTPEEAKQKGL